MVAPAVGIMPPNASLTIASVLGYTVWPAGSLSGSRPAVRPDQTLYSFSLQINAVRPERPDGASMAQAGSTIEAFSLVPLNPDLVGTTIEATLHLTGDTLGSRWMISGITPQN